MTKSSKKELKDVGFLCECGKAHIYPAYVHAHWNIELKHTCDCRRIHLIQFGIATLVKIGDKKQ